MSLGKPADQDIIVIGATGDLSRRKLLPALYSLYVRDLLPSQGRIIGYARKYLSEEEFRDMASASIREFSGADVNENTWRSFAERLTFTCAEPDGFPGVKRACTQSAQLIYLSIPPSAFPSTVEALGESGFGGGARLVVEKPFGRDLQSSRELDRALRAVFDEAQIFRIDHYLGKETVQNILVFRFGNSIFERAWNRDAIDHVQITVAESLGIEGRGAFYEETGALRDIIQNHVFQVLSVLTMEPPISFDPEAIRDEKVKLFHAIQPVGPRDTVRAQYSKGTLNGEQVRGYREEDGVSSGSATETYVAMRLSIDNWRWAGVPIFVRTGKRMPRRATEVLISFRDVPVRFFEGTDVEELPANHLALSIQPDEGITFTFLAKVPGPEIRVKPVDMDFSFGESFMARPAEAYERLLHDAMDGDHTLFARGDGVDRAWSVVQPVLDDLPPVSAYPAGTWGPPEADALIAPRHWHLR